MVDRFPDILPNVVITKMLEEPFQVKFEQVLGSFVYPKVGEKSYYAEYDTRKDILKKKSGENRSFVKRKAKVHGKNCVEVIGTYVGIIDGKVYESSIYERVTDTHVQTLAAIEDSYGTLLIQTFLDEDFKKHWAIGKNNCGREIILKQKGIINCDKELNIYSKKTIPGTYDVVGRYKVSIGEKVFDTIRLVLIACDGQVTDFYIDSKGREIMHRFWVLDSWGYDDDLKILYSERWPHVDVLYLNDVKRVCIDYIVPDYVF